MAIKYDVTRYSFDMKKELTLSQGLKLCAYASDYLRRFGYANFGKATFVKTYFWLNPWTIRVEVERQVLGLKRTKSYCFDLYEDTVKLIKQEELPNESAYSVVQEISCPTSKSTSFLEFVADQLKDQTADYGIQVVKEEYDKDQREV